MWGKDTVASSGAPYLMVVMNPALAAVAGRTGIVTASGLAALRGRCGNGRERTEDGGGWWRVGRERTEE